jgi:methyl-accepting chemotaxis protein
VTSQACRSADHRRQSSRLPGLISTIAAVAGAVVVLSAPSSTWAATSWPAVLAGFFAGIGCAAAVVGIRVMRPLTSLAEVCSRVATGDLSQTVPERGPRQLRAAATVFNAVLADFQEVLLLFAYFLRSARASLQDLGSRAHADGGDGDIAGLLSSVLNDVTRMQEMVEGFKYFRVRIDRGTITDTGVIRNPAPGLAGSPALDDRAGAGRLQAPEKD